jgi:hypothetical protein
MAALRKIAEIPMRRQIDDDEFDNAEDMAAFRELEVLEERRQIHDEFNNAEDMAASRKLAELKERTKIHNEIRENLEMPREWFESMQAQAYPPSTKQGEGLNNKEKMMNAQVDILLAKTLLVYERLNTFYM